MRAQPAIACKPEITKRLKVKLREDSLEKQAVAEGRAIAPTKVIALFFHLEPFPSVFPLQVESEWLNRLPRF